MVTGRKVFFFLLLTSFLFFTTFFPAMAEEKVENEDVYRNFANYANIGFSGLNNLTALNSTLTANNYSPFSGWFLSLGTGTRAFLGNVVYGAESNFVIEQKHSNSNGFKNYLSYTGNMLANAGYVLFSSGEFRVYPLVGAGFGSIRMDFFENHDKTDFSQVLTTPRSGTTMSRFGLLADLGLAADYVLDIGKSEKKYGGLMFAVRGGYIFTLYQTDFSIKDTAVDNMPEINFNGPYLRIYAGVTDNFLKAAFDLF